MEPAAQRASTKNLKFNVQFDDLVPDCLEGDASRLKQVLNLLLSDAVRFTSSGAVGISITQQSADGLEVLVKFAVAETGTGGSLTRRFDSTACDLEECTGLVGELGGTLRLDSARGGQELTLAFEIPLKVRQPDPGGATPLARPNPIDPQPSDGEVRILLAEDNIVNQKLAVTLLKKRGWEVAVAVNGAAAVHAVETANFDLIVMDIQMPEMDGLQATRAIRTSSDPTRSHVPIVALTANTSPRDVERCMEAGMNGHVPKPIRPDILYQTIEEFLPARTRPQLRRECGVLQ